MHDKRELDVGNDLEEKMTPYLHQISMRMQSGYLLLFA
jgi:hypothetical protein